MRVVDLAEMLCAIPKALGRSNKPCCLTYDVVFSLWAHCHEILQQYTTCILYFVTLTCCQCIEWIYSKGPEPHRNRND